MMCYWQFTQSGSAGTKWWVIVTSLQDQEGVNAIIQGVTLLMPGECCSLQLGRYFCRGRLWLMHDADTMHSRGREEAEGKDSVSA